MRSEVVSFLTCERACPFVASSRNSEVGNGSTEERDSGVAGAGPVKKVRVWSSFIEGSEGKSNKSDWRIQLVLVSEVVGRIQLLWYQAVRTSLSIFHTKVSSLKAR